MNGHAEQTPEIEIAPSISEAPDGLAFWYPEL
jgi:hypothetical protein